MMGTYDNSIIIATKEKVWYTEYMWSWVLACIGIAGIFLVGRKTVWGWLILCVNECLWIAYALATDQYGFIFMAVAYAAVYIKSFIHWRKDE